MIHSLYVRYRYTGTIKKHLLRPADVCLKVLSAYLPPLLVQRCTGTTAVLGYLEVNVICPCKSPPWAVGYCPHYRFPLGENGTIRLLTLTLTQTHQFCPNAKKKLQVHIKPTPTKQDPKQNIVCTTVCALQNIIISIVCEIKIQ
jgi:hypothetical protein